MSGDGAMLEELMNEVKRRFQNADATDTANQPSISEVAEFVMRFLSERNAPSEVMQKI